MEKANWKYGMAAMAAVWLILALAAWLHKPNDISLQERRPLAQFPDITAENLQNGRFMEDFESYTLDQFPARTLFRQLKALTHYHVLGQRDNNGIYLTQGQAAKLEYPLKEESVLRARRIFTQIREKYLAESQVFVSVVPDKGYYLAKENGYLAMDYDRLFAIMSGMEGATYVPLTDCLTGSDYYRTDTHWRQERLFPAAQKLCNAMNIPSPQPEDYRPTAASEPFYGVYYGQAALPMNPDILYTLQGDLLEQCTVYNYETGTRGGIYDWSKLSGSDLYQVFLSGSVSLLRIDNPNAQTERELIVFRDSFGSAMAPLLVQGYKSVTLVDIRYLSSAMLDRFIDFHGQDVLFLYSTIVLNNSETLQ